MNCDIACIGDATIDAFLTINNSNSVHLNNDSTEIYFKYGEKIQVDDCSFFLGGNACNVSVGLSRLGLKSSITAETGDDEFAQKIINMLSLEKVDRSLLKQTKGAKASFAIGINFKGERTLFVEHVKREHDFPIEGIFSKWFYLTSMGEEWVSLYKKVHEKVLKDKIKLAFNPGTHQIEKGLESVSSLLKESEILFLNKEEAIKLLGKDLEIRDLLFELKELGVQIVVITDGNKGSLVLDKEGKVHLLGIYDSPIVERTGAGDSYTAGFLAAIIQGLSIEDAMRWGTFNAASVVGKVGAQPGLLTKEEMEKISNENREFKARRI